MKLDEDAKETLRVLTTMVVLDLRAAYLAAGANPLKHWDQLYDRICAALRTSMSVEEWHTAMTRSLQLGVLPGVACAQLSALVKAVGPHRSEWLDLIERESGYVLACARLEAERRREARSVMDTVGLEGA